MLVTVSPFGYPARMTSCGHTHVVMNTDLGVAHLAGTGGEPLCGERLRHPLAARTIQGLCPDSADHCVECEAVIVGHAVLIGSELVPT